MSLFVNASEQEAFHVIMDYFTSTRTKILTSNSPHYIKAEFGSWTSMSLDKAMGEVEVKITERNGGSDANLNFSFFKEYLFTLIIAILGTILICAIMWWRANRDMPLNPADVENFLSRVNLITFGLSVVMFVVTLGLVRYSTSLTRKRFIRELDMFLQSLHSKKD